MSKRKRANSAAPGRGLLEAAENGAPLAKEEYEAALPELRVKLVNAQYDLRDSGRAALVMIDGDDPAGAAELFRGLHEWMDARFLAARAYGAPDPCEAGYPPFWRYWRDLPPRGRVGLWLGGWLETQLRVRAGEGQSNADFERALDWFRNFEAELVSDGAVVLKLWIHLPEREHARRAKKARKRKKVWRPDELDWRICSDYDAVAPVAEEILRRAKGAVVVDGSDERHRNLSVARAVLAAVEQAAAAAPVANGDAASARVEPVDLAASPLASVDFPAAMPWEDYKKRLVKLQRRLFELAERAQARALRTVIVLQGVDAAGKGGVVRRITQALDARDYHVVAVGPPSETERQYPYLWRFWRQIPPAGRVVIFDRSWYGRVLVERVDGFASEAAWARAYAEINDFEEQLVAADSVVLKFWLHIDADEQLRRFRARESTPYKKYKITADDYHNRRKWDAYAAAAAEMVLRTDKPAAPWHVVAANDKRSARLEVMETICSALRRATKGGD